MGWKCDIIGNNTGEHSRNLLGTPWELGGMHWEQHKIKESNTLVSDILCHLLYRHIHVAYNVEIFFYTITMWIGEIIGPL